MRTLAHISDVHFGREDPDLIPALLASIADARPEIIVVSGDLTQRAKKRQFRAARTFLQALPPVPRIVVPGNHDVSATNLMERMARPLRRYQRYITADMSPTYADSECALAGIDTVRLLARKDGRLNRRQVETACAQLAAAPSSAIRIVVTHHPMDKLPEDTKNAILGRARMAMTLFAAAGVDLFLSGHLHTGLTLATGARYPLPGYSAVMAQAGTAISTRTRHGVPNAWNLIELHPGQIAVRQMRWTGQRYAPAEPDLYAKSPQGWGKTTAHGETPDSGRILKATPSAVPYLPPNRAG